jgi:hypothetical protein
LLSLLQRSAEGLLDDGAWGLVAAASPAGSPAGVALLTFPCCQLDRFARTQTHTPLLFPPPSALPQMVVNITCDHRTVYGAHAAEFLQSLKAVIESPDQLVF